VYNTATDYELTNTIHCSLFTIHCGATRRVACWEGALEGEASDWGEVVTR